MSSEVKTKSVISYRIDKKVKREYPTHPVVWVTDFLQSYFYVRLEENSKVCKKCLGFIPTTQCANCVKLEPFWFAGLPGTFVL